MEHSRALRKFHAQKKSARLRGIGWELTFDQWLAWWGNDINRRGPHAGQLQMCRNGDEGPYRLDNIHKGTPKQNGKTRSDVYRNRQASSTRQKMQEELLARSFYPHGYPNDDQPQQRDAT